MFQQNFDKALFTEALKSTAVHRNTTEQISDITGILHNIEESDELKTTWDKYRKQFAYAKDIDYVQIIDTIKNLV